MIGKLQGLIDYVGDDYVIVMVGQFPSSGGVPATAGGVGYKVFTPDASRLTPHASHLTTFWIETIVREDSIRLFGFESLAAQDLFNKLTGVSGVGPKVAMNILGALRPETLMTAIATGDAKTITAAPGVGKKVAEKIIVELKGKCEVWNVKCETDNSTLHTSHSTLADLLSALETLGYKRVDVVELAQKLVRENPDAEVGALVRLALKEISK